MWWRSGSVTDGCDAGKEVHVGGCGAAGKVWCQNEYQVEGWMGRCDANKECVVCACVSRRKG